MWFSCWSPLQISRSFYFTPENSTYYNFHPQSFPCLQTYCLDFFYWSSLIQKEAWAMTSGEWEQYVTAKLLTNFKHLKKVSTFLLILQKKKPAYLWDSKEKKNSYS